MTSAESSPCLPGSAGGYFSFDHSYKADSHSQPPPLPNIKITVSPPAVGTGAASSNNMPGSSSGSSEGHRDTPATKSKVALMKEKPPLLDGALSKGSFRIEKLPTQLNAVHHGRILDCGGMGIHPVCSIEDWKMLLPNENSADGDADLVVLDLRPFNQYNVSRVKGALSICVPSTLLKRSSFHLSNIFKTMDPSQEKELEEKLQSDRDLKVVLYDANSSVKQCSLHLYQIVKKFQDSMDQYDKNIELYVLDRGFSLFTDYESQMNRGDQHSPDHPRDSPIDHNIFKSSQSKESKSPTFANFLLPSADPTTAFLMSLKKNHILPDTADVSLFVPTFKSTKWLPNWIIPYTDPSSVGLIVSNFLKIENIENARIGNSIQRRPSASPGDFITLNGSEYGFKNRYPNILPYEHSRVKLVPSPMSTTTTPSALPNFYFPQMAPGASSPSATSQTIPAISPNHVDGRSVSPNAPSSMNSALSSNTALSAVSPTNKRDDYFNANFIDVPQINDELHYIATQAPLPSTFDDFWKVVWHNKTEVIISLTNLNENGVRKSDVYWKNNPQVELLEEIDNYEGLDNFTIRKIKLMRRGKSRIVHQLHFKSWPDFGTVVPKDLLKLMEIKDKFVENKKSPIVVHCSAGCGRTGVFITIDVILGAFKKSQSGDSASSSGSIDVWKTQDDVVDYTVQQLRKQRISMVQSLNQFILCYETVLQFFAMKEN